MRSIWLPSLFCYDIGTTRSRLLLEEFNYGGCEMGVTRRHLANIWGLIEVLYSCEIKLI